MSSQGFPRALRVRRRADFLRTQNRGEKHHLRHFLVFVASSRPRADGQEGRRDQTPRRDVTAATRTPALPPTRLGVTVTRKVGSAVVRNRIKRLVRESFRREASRFLPGLSLVWVAKRDAAKVSYSEVVDQMLKLARRLDRPSRNARREFSR